MAVLWAWSFARSVEVRVSWIAVAVLGTGTWIIYVADRLLDSRFSAFETLRERHFFHARHRRGFLVGSAAAGILLLALVWMLPAVARRDDAVVFAGAMVYFAAVHGPMTRLRSWFVREIAVGIVFACAVAIPAWSACASPHAQLVWLVLLFAGLCMLNCISIEQWEREGAATHSPRVAVLAVCVAVASATMLLLRFRNSGSAPLLAAVFSSALLLFALDCLQLRFAGRGGDPDNRARPLLALRVAADAALLTPLVCFLLWRR